MSDYNELAAENTDLQEEISDLKAENKKLQECVNDLQSGMYINCVYCGHRYGPREDVPTSMADVLKEHIEKCPKHPMSKLKAENDALKAYQVFYDHLRRCVDEYVHPDEKVICKLCNNTFEAITGVSEDVLNDDSVKCQCGKPAGCLDGDGVDICADCKIGLLEETVKDVKAENELWRSAADKIMNNACAGEAETDYDCHLLCSDEDCACGIVSAVLYELDGSPKVLMVISEDPATEDDFIETEIPGPEAAR